MAARKNECHDCEIVFLKKGNAACPECGSDNFSPYAPLGREFENESGYDISDDLDEFELRDFYSRAKNNY